MKTMRQSNSKSNVSVTIEQHSLEIGLSGIVTARTLDAILKEATRQKGRESPEPDVVNLIVDLSRVNVIRPDGAIGLVCLCSALMTNKVKEIRSPTTIYLRRPPERVLSYLTRIGFFTQMSVKANLLGHGDLVHLEDQWKERDRNERTQGILGERFDSDKRPIVWPMQLIGRREDQYTRRDFEDACQHLVNNAADHFYKLFSSRHFNFDESDRHDFLLANYELYMNVYDHSGSWGLAMIHARPEYGTFMCCSDIGMGIRESVNASPNIKRNFDTDYDAIKWAVVEGNSSKVGGNGLGLNIVEDFVSSRKGIIEIRSGECLLQKRSGDADWEAHRVPWFPGTQVNVFVPVRS